MNTLSKSNKINFLIIENTYSVTGKPLRINIDPAGNKNLNISNLVAIRKLANMPTIKTVKEYYSEFFSLLNIDYNLDNRLILGELKTKEYNEYLKKEIDLSMSILTDYHFDIFPKRVMIYRGLGDVYLNGKILEKPTYDHSGVTGRTSIKKGFNFLTMKKEDRKFLSLNNKNYHLVEVDFKSCEPFFYLLANNFQIEGTDVYAWISKKYDIDISNRDKTKRGILSMMYGANESTISRVMGVKESLVKKMKDELGIFNLNDRLEKEYQQNGFILNHYGRPITSNKNLVNYWIQSSAVDFCSLAFNDFCNINNVKPAYFIHDSMTFIVEKENVDKVMKQKFIKDQHTNIQIPVEYNIIS